MAVTKRTFSLAALLLCGALRVANAATIIVPDDHATIQAAIDAATSGFDTVQVRPGTYVEALVIEDKTVITIEGLGGTPVIAPGPGAKGVFVRRSLDVTLDNLMITGAGIGVLAKKKVDRIDFVDVTITDCGRGAIAKASGRVRAFRLVVTGSTRGDGFKAASAGPAIGESTFSGNKGSGASLRNIIRSSISSQMGVFDSTFTDNGKFGLRVTDKRDAEVERNEASRNGTAGVLFKAKGQAPRFVANEANDNGTYGFDLRGNVFPEATYVAANSATGNGILDFRVQ